MTDKIADLIQGARGYASTSDGVSSTAARYIALLCEQIERLRTPAEAAMIVKRYIETTRPTSLASWYSTMKDMNYIAAEPAAALAKHLPNPPMENSGEMGNTRAAAAMTGNLPVAAAPTNLTPQR